ncbi:MAG TPA: ParA family protein [Limnochordales bacterium]
MVAVCNPKGGVAKTTSAFHLGCAWAAMGRRVLWVDLDPQAALTAWALGPQAGQRDARDAGGPGGAHPPGRAGEAGRATVAAGLMGRAEAGKLVLATPHGPDLLPSGLELAVAEMELVAHPAPERRLLRLLAPLRDRYDYVLVDCQPSLGLLVQNALAAADGVVVPVACEYLAVRALGLLMRALRRVRLEVNSQLAVLAVVPTLYDRRTLHARQALEEVRRSFGERTWVADWPVVKSVRFAEAARQGVPVWTLSPLHPGGEAYRAVAAGLEGRRVQPPIRWDQADEEEDGSAGMQAPWRPVPA